MLVHRHRTLTFTNTTLAGICIEFSTSSVNDEADASTDVTWFAESHFEDGRKAEMVANYRKAKEKGATLVHCIFLRLRYV